ncbi:hypothetical protein EV363DRAFT_1451171 [Boletus edulis]|nr:hypothetical protein EV363DRAFT_1451171 [Boletus edulis]
MLSYLVQKSGEVTRLQRNKTSLQSTVDTQRREISNANDTISRLQRDKTSLQSTVDTQRREISNANDTISRLQRDKTSLQSTVDTQRREISNANDTISRLQRDKTSLQSTVDTQRREISNANDTISRLQRDKTSLQSTVDTQRREISSANETISRLQRDKSDLQSAFDALRTETAPLRIPNGTYRIRSNIGNICLACPQNAPGAVVGSDQPSDAQKWNISLGTDGGYIIRGNSNVLLTIGIRNAVVAGSRATTWTFEPRGEPRGNAYVIGNAVNATAIQLAPNRQSVSVYPRNNSANQRWILEPVTN